MLRRLPAIELQAKLFRGLADPSRLSILEALRARPLSVGAIVTATGLTQPNASNHLRCLSECGLVLGEPQGRFVHYRLSDPRIDQVLTLTKDLLTGPAEGLARCAKYQVAARRGRRHMGVPGHQREKDSVPSRRPDEC